MTIRSDQPTSDPDGWRQIGHDAIVALPFDEACRRMADRATDLFGARRWAPAAEFELAVHRPGDDRRETVVVHLGGLVRIDDRAVLPMGWSDPEQPGLPPVLKSVIMLAPGEEGDGAGTRIALVGRYRAPLSTGCVTAFLDDLAGQLEEAGRVADSA